MIKALKTHFQKAETPPQHIIELNQDERFLAVFAAGIILRTSRDVTKTNHQDSYEYTRAVSAAADNLNEIQKMDTDSQNKAVLKLLSNLTHENQLRAAFYLENICRKYNSDMLFTFRSVRQTLEKTSQTQPVNSLC
jgi:hypothetical protein